MNGSLQRMEQPLSLHEKLMECIIDLMKLSNSLREALVRRDTERIWDILAEQEEQAVMLDEYSRLWHDMTDSDTGVVSEETTAIRKTLRHQLNHLRAVQQSNAMLAQGFLSAIRKALSSLGKEAGPRPNVYNKKGRMGGKRSSVIVRRLG